MIGDVVIPKPHHTKAAKQIFALIGDELRDGRVALTIAGESGSGKSEIAHELARLLADGGIRTYIFGQDDYFVLPPKTNEKTRRKDIAHVGLSEVKITLLDAHLAAFKHAPDKPIEKPLVIFDEDRITSETINPGDYTIAIAEGTYTTRLDSADHHIFIDRDYHDTLEHRKDRSREAQDDFLENVLKIEHDIISQQKARADIIVNRDYSVTKVKD